MNFIRAATALSLACVWLLNVPLYADTVQRSTQRDIQGATQELAKLNKLIEADKARLLEQLRRLSDASSAKRLELQGLQRLRDSRDYSLEALRSTIAQKRTQLEGLKGDFPKPEGVNIAWTDRIHALSNQLQRLQRQAGGEHFEGLALDGNGIQRQGRFIAFGSNVYFFSQNGSGSVTFDAEKVASINPFPEAHSKLDELLKGKQVILPIRINEDSIPKESIFAHLKKGGFWVIPIALLGGATLIIACSKSFTILKLKILNSRRAKTLQLPFGQLQKIAMEHKGSSEALEHKLVHYILSWQNQLERGLPLLASSAAVAPLLGLLGTVTGMIHTFERIHSAGLGDPRVLSVGISEALISTECGLIVAIAAFLLHAGCLRSIRSHIGEAENFIETLLQKNSSTEPS